MKACVLGVERTRQRFAQWFGCGTGLRPVLTIAVAAALFSASKPARTADFEVTPGTDTKFPIVKVKGEIKLGDDRKFSEAVGFLVRAIVYLDSPGGMTIEAIRIGEIIRARDFTTAIPKSALCTSACALIWLAGTERFVGKDAKLGLHAAFVKRNERTEESGAGNAVVGAYMTHLGYVYEAIVFSTSAGPNDMNWLTEGNALKLGIMAKFGAAPIEERGTQGATVKTVIPIPRSKPSQFSVSSNPEVGVLPGGRKLDYDRVPASEVEEGRKQIYDRVPASEVEVQGSEVSKLPPASPIHKLVE